MKTYQVVAAIIKRDNRIFATQRGYGDHKDGWEFPGGKIEPGETPEQAIVREIQEELEMTIEVDRHVVDVAYDYPTFHLEMGSPLSIDANNVISIDLTSYATKQYVDDAIAAILDLEEEEF